MRLKGFALGRLVNMMLPAHQSDLENQSGELETSYWLKVAIFSWSETVFRNSFQGFIWQGPQFLNSVINLILMKIAIRVHFLLSWLFVWAMLCPIIRIHWSVKQAVIDAKYNGVVILFCHAIFWYAPIIMMLNHMIDMPLFQCSW